MAANESSGITHGECRLGDSWVSHVSHPAGLELPHHEHEHACLHVVIAGCYQERTSGGEAMLPVGHALWKPAGYGHANRFARGARTVRVEVLRTAATPPEPLAMMDPRLCVLAHRLRRELERDDDLTMIGGEALVCQMLALLTRRGIDAAPAAVVADCAELLRSRACRADLRLSAIADELRCDRSGLARAFHRTYRCTMGDWVRQQRIAAAMIALADPGIPLATVALRAGFADQSHLTRVFRALVGTTPGAFRRR